MGNGSRLSVLKEDCTKLGGLERHVESISKLESMNFIACGTSYYAALFALKFF
jgi:glucosamine--fructose-6-phosphate aminotransferase (isomerizing)